MYIMLHIFLFRIICMIILVHVVIHRAFYHLCNIYLYMHISGIRRITGYYLPILHPAEEE